MPDTGVADRVEDVLATTMYPVEPLGVKLMVPPVVVVDGTVNPVGCVAGATAVGLFTSNGTDAEQVPVL